MECSGNTVAKAITCLIANVNVALCSVKTLFWPLASQARKRKYLMFDVASIKCLSSNLNTSECYKGNPWKTSLVAGYNPALLTRMSIFSSLSLSLLAHCRTEFREERSQLSTTTEPPFDFFWWEMWLKSNIPNPTWAGLAPDGLGGLVRPLLVPAEHDDLGAPLVQVLGSNSMGWMKFKSTIASQFDQFLYLRGHA